MKYHQRQFQLVPLLSKKVIHVASEEIIEDKWKFIDQTGKRRFNI